MMKQDDETILVEQNITEPKTKTLPANSSDAETTPLVVIEEEMSVEEDKFGGVILTVKKHINSASFASNLEDSISYWKQQGKKGMWLNLPIQYSNNLVESASKAGFQYHHAEVDYLMLVYRIPDTSASFPPNASHRVRIGAFVFNEKKEDQGANRLHTVSQEDILEQKAWKLFLRESVLYIQDTDGDGGNSSHGRNEEDRENINELRKAYAISGACCNIPGIIFSGKDSFVDPKVFDPLISDGKLETLYKKLHAIWSNILAVKFQISDGKFETLYKKLHAIWSNILAVKFHLLRGNRETTNNLLPVSRNDSANSQFGQEALSFKDFLMSVLNMPGEQRAIILLLFFGILKTLAESAAGTPLFEFQSGIATIPQTVLSLKEAILIFSPETAYTSLFIIVYIITWLHILKLQPGLLISLVVLMIFAPVLLLSHLVRNASATGVHVRFCGFNLPVIAFTAVYTFVFCLFFAFAVFLVLRVIWKFFHQRTPARYQEPGGTDALLAGIDLE